MTEWYRDRREGASNRLRARKISALKVLVLTGRIKNPGFTNHMLDNFKRLDWDVSLKALVVSPHIFIFYLILLIKYHLNLRQKSKNAF